MASGVSDDPVNFQVNALAFFTLREKKVSPVKNEPPRRDPLFQKLFDEGKWVERRGT